MGFYYLKTRYYDPEIGRFITIDDTSYLDPDSVNGLNLYAYCGNNPVMNVDPEGTSWWNPFSWNWAKIGMIAVSVLEVVGGIALIVVSQGSLLGTGIGIIGTGIGSIVSGFVNEYNGGSFAAGWTGSQIGGALSLLPVIGPVIGGFVGSVVFDKLNGKGINWKNAFLSAGLGFLFGKISAAFDLAAAEIIGDIVPQVVNGFNAFIISIINIIIDAFKGE